MTVYPEIDPASPIQFVSNAAAGSGAAESRRELIESALRAEATTGSYRGLIGTDLITPT